MDGMRLQAAELVDGYTDIHDFSVYPAALGVMRVLRSERGLPGLVDADQRAVGTDRGAPEVGVGQHLLLGEQADGEGLVLQDGVARELLAGLGVLEVETHLEPVGEQAHQRGILLVGQLGAVRVGLHRLLGERDQFRGRGDAGRDEQHPTEHRVEDDLVALLAQAELLVELQDLRHLAGRHALVEHRRVVEAGFHAVQRVFDTVGAAAAVHEVAVSRHCFPPWDRTTLSVATGCD